MKKLFVSILVLIFSFISYSQPAKSPYPIIFIHGLNDNGETWDSILNYLGGQERTFDVCLNDDGNNLSSNIDDDVLAVGWRNLPSTPSPTRLYVLNFDNDQMVGHETHSLSNQASIYSKEELLIS